MLKLGARFQGVIDPDGNDQRDSILASTAVLAEVGFFVNIPLSERIHLQSGISFPIAYEIAPLPVLEYQWTNIHAGVSYAFPHQVLFLKGSMGSAIGESKSSNTPFIETSF
jgi:hypothetical protein